MRKYLYIIYDSTDPYELPLVVFDTLRECALWLECEYTELTRSLAFRNFRVEKVGVS